MAADTRISTAAAIAQCNATVDLLDGGKIKLYSVGAGIPATVDTAISNQVLLAECTYGTPAFGDAASDSGKATATANAITKESSVKADGTLSFFRACKADGTAVIQGTVGTASADLIVDGAAVEEEGEVIISSQTYSVLEGA